MIPTDDYAQPEEVENALRLTVENHPWLIQQEDCEQAIKLPRTDRGEFLFGCLMANTSNVDH
jgi:hypothetical protein